MVHVLSGGQGRESVAVGGGADLDEGPDSVAADGDTVEAAVEADRDRLSPGRAAVGEAGIADLAAGLLVPKISKRPRAGAARAVPAPVVPLPQFGFELSNVAVAVHDPESVAAVACYRQHAPLPVLHRSAG